MLIMPAVDIAKPLLRLRVDSALIGEFGEEHRDFVPINEIPQVMKDALLSIEDSRFYEHGIDFRGITREFVADLTSRRLLSLPTVVHDWV